MSLLGGITNTLGITDAAPGTPDYIAAANATAANNLKASEAATTANRVNQTNQYGTSNYTKNPDGSWSLNSSLNAPQQGLLDASTAAKTAGATDAGTLASGLLGNTQSLYDNIPNMPINAGTTGYDAQMKLLQPQIDRENTQSDAELAAQGITPGSEAYKNAKQVLNQSHDTLMTQAAQNGVGLDLTANAQGNTNTNNRINTGNNTFSTLNNGSNPVNLNSTLANVPQQTTTAGADILGATTAGYNAALGATNADNASTMGLLGAAATLGAGALAKPTPTPSDRRLKQHIVKLFKRPDGLNVYSYNYKSGFGLSTIRQIGLMADEVMKLYPEAIGTRPDGFNTVDYARV